MPSGDYELEIPFKPGVGKSPLISISIPHMFVIWCSTPSQPVRTSQGDVAETLSPARCLGACRAEAPDLLRNQGLLNLKLGTIVCPVVFHGYASQESFNCQTEEQRWQNASLLESGVHREGVFQLTVVDDAMLLEERPDAVGQFLWAVMGPSRARLEAGRRRLSQSQQPPVAVGWSIPVTTLGSVGEQRCNRCMTILSESPLGPATVKCLKTW